MLVKKVNKSQAAVVVHAVSQHLGVKTGRSEFEASLDGLQREFLDSQDYVESPCLKTKQIYFEQDPRLRT